MEKRDTINKRKLINEGKAICDAHPKKTYNWGAIDTLARQSRMGDPIFAYNAVRDAYHLGMAIGYRISQEEQIKKIAGQLKKIAGKQR